MFLYPRLRHRLPWVPNKGASPKRASYLFIVSLAWPSRPHWKVASSTRLLGSLQPLSSLPALSVYNRTVCVILLILLALTYGHVFRTWYGGSPTGTGSMSSSSAYIHRTLQTGGLMEAPKQMTGPAVTTKNTFCVRPEGRCVCVQRAALGWLTPARRPLACSQACVTAQQRQPTAEGLDALRTPRARPGDVESTTVLRPCAGSGRQGRVRPRRRAWDARPPASV